MASTGARVIILGLLTVVLALGLSDCNRSASDTTGDYLDSTVEIAGQQVANACTTLEKTYQRVSDTVTPKLDSLDSIGRQLVLAATSYAMCLDDLKSQAQYLTTGVSTTSHEDQEPEAWPCWPEPGNHVDLITLYLSLWGVIAAAWTYLHDKPMPDIYLEGEKLRETWGEYFGMKIPWLAVVLGVIFILSVIMFFWYLVALFTCDAGEAMASAYWSCLVLSVVGATCLIMVLATAWGQQLMVKAIAKRDPKQSHPPRQ
ncbi:MAG: hypothetical protein ABII79_03690 [bacterium]